MAMYEFLKYASLWHTTYKDNFALYYHIIIKRIINNQLAFVWSCTVLYQQEINLDWYLFLIAFSAQELWEVVSLKNEMGISCCSGICQINVHCFTVLPTVLGVSSVKICMNRICISWWSPLIQGCQKSWASQGLKILSFWRVWSITWTPPSFILKN